MKLHKDEAAKGYPIFFLFVVALSFLAYDDYLDPPGVRIFDVIGVVILFFLAVSGNLQVQGVGRRLGFAKVWLLIAMLTLAVAYGVILRGATSPFAFVIGFLVFVTLGHSLAFKENVQRILAVLLTVAATALIVQFVIYLVTGHMFSLLLTGQNLRTLYAGVVSRPTGIYAEAGSHAAAVAMLLVPYVMLTRKINYLIIFSTLSILFSQSLFGVVAVAALLIYYLSLLKFNVKSIAAVVLFAMTILVFGYWSETNLTIFTRIDKISDPYYAEQKDGSYKYRIEGMAGGGCLEAIMQKNTFNILFGEGISSTHYQEKCGVNAFAWLLTSFGIIGGLVMVVMMFSLLKYDFALIAFAMVFLLPYPLVSYGFFWMWMAIMATVATKRAEHRNKDIGSVMQTAEA